MSKEVENLELETAIGFEGSLFLRFANRKKLKAKFY
jgi:hypothetical protein